MYPYVAWRGLHIRSRDFFSRAAFIFHSSQQILQRSKLSTVVVISSVSVVDARSN